MQTEIFRQCVSNSHWERKVGQYLVSFGRTFKGNYDYDYSCDCKGFKYRGKCKHVEEAQNLRCGWHEQFVTGEVIDEKCPACGNETEAVTCAV